MSSKRAKEYKNRRKIIKLTSLSSNFVEKRLAMLSTSPDNEEASPNLHYRKLHMKFTVMHAWNFLHLTLSEVHPNDLPRKSKRYLYRISYRQRTPSFDIASWFLIIEVSRVYPRYRFSTQGSLLHAIPYLKKLNYCNGYLQWIHEPAARFGTRRSI